MHPISSLSIGDVHVTMQQPNYVIWSGSETFCHEVKWHFGCDPCDLGRMPKMQTLWMGGMYWKFFSFELYFKEHVIISSTNTWNRKIYCEARERIFFLSGPPELRRVGGQGGHWPPKTFPDLVKRCFDQMLKLLKVFQRWQPKNFKPSLYPAIHTRKSPILIIFFQKKS